MKLSENKVVNNSTLPCYHPPEDTTLDARHKYTQDDKFKTLKENKQVVTNGLINIPQKKRRLLSVVPMKLRISEFSEFVATQTLLEGGSTRTFITENLMKELGMKDCEDAEIWTITLNESHGHH